ncbi:MAG: hypothetical protein KC478_05390, partial [Bacteriovoracaceae bacterium]|nr:hypothetical protein [Bacteriovoracaceae bacterium]
MNNLKKHCIQSLKNQNSDALAVGVIDFNDHSFNSFELEKSSAQVFEGNGDIYFDLASLSKPLTNSLGAFSAPELVSDQMKLLLNHRSGLPAWGL